MPSCLKSENRLGRGVLGYGRSVLIRQEKEALLLKDRYLTDGSVPKVNGPARVVDQRW